jgi:pimeloyl-ACP methyl ester carboxylesterase
MPEVEGAGVALHYAERGDGTPLLIVHGMASDAAAWEPALNELAAAGARAIAYDRRGYGASGAPQPYVATTVQEQSEDAAALLRGLDAAPAILVGTGFGALVVLELLVRRPELALAAVLADPPLFAFVPAATAVLAAERSLLEEALREGGPSDAIAAWLGDGVEAGRLARARASPLGFFADYAGQSSWSPARRELRAIALPVAIVTGPATAAHVVAAADAASALLPDARRTHDDDVVAAAGGLLTPS